ncbi:Thiol-disulfide isomerase or thioredoxin [Chitinophaga niabensis]|uniref:Thiol-disulfide isomerase or thioredoxin n=2 Tax=Chitinophaga niabensis TaxID=536979 RepID=A0A1N6E3E7_9BACT|nr:Thiol-disulfide isomerase or thioredoxin [Chitinophaga niabensis]
MWSDRPKLTYEISTDRVTFFSNLEIRSLEYREWGISFWKAFPHDQRRFTWFEETVAISPRYFVDPKLAAQDRILESYQAKIDYSAKQKWELQYQKFRKEYMESPIVTSTKKWELKFAELSNSVMMGMYPDNQGRKHFNYVSFVRNLLKYAKYYYEEIPYKPYKTTPVLSDKITSTLYVPIEHPRFLNMTVDDQKNMLKMIIESEVDKRLKEFAAKKLSVISLKDIPLNLAGLTPDSNHIDLKDYLNKLVFVDIWSIGCSSCIAMMPKLKKVYEKYKTRGFTVLSVDVSGPKYYQQIMRIHHEIGADWPFMLLNNDQYNTLFSTYGMLGVPQTFLVGKDGKVIMYKDQVSSPEGLEEYLNKYFSDL